MRIRPKTMTVATTFMGLVPLMWAGGTGADTMRRLAAPMIGGLATSFFGELLVFPAVYFVYKRFSELHWEGKGYWPANESPASPS